MKLILSVPIAVVIACATAGCGPEIRPSLSMERQQRYGRLAIVCAPRSKPTRLTRR